MAKIIYKDGCEGQNRLECIEGIEIELLNGQKALVYPKYAVREMLPEDKIKSYDAESVTEIEALKKTDSNWATGALLKLGSPAAEYVAGFHSARFGLFALPTLLAAMEIQDQKKDIDELAETVEGADLLRNFTSGVWSCSRCASSGGWYADGGYGFAGNYHLYSQYLCIPLVLYR